MSRKRLYTKSYRQSDGSVLCPFRILIDTSEVQAYTFEGIRTNVDEGHRPINVPTAGFNLYYGDYSLWENGQSFEDRVLIERKAKGDFLGSVSKRENFEERLAGMSKCDYAAVVVECEWSEYERDFRLGDTYSKLNFKSLYNTVLAWSRRWPVRWYFCRDRRVAEMTCFRLLEGWYRDYK